MLLKVYLTMLVITSVEGLLASCSASVGNSICVPRVECETPLDSFTCGDKSCCKNRTYPQEVSTPPAGDCICVDAWQECGKAVKPFLYPHLQPDCACCECTVRCAPVINSGMCRNGLSPIGECDDHRNKYCCNPKIEAMTFDDSPPGMLRPMACACYNGACPPKWDDKGSCKKCCVV